VLALALPAAVIASVTAVAESLAAAPAGGPGLESLFSGQAAVALLTLAALEIVLGIDNVVFISILVAKLPAERQAAARRLGLGLAMGMRILLLLAISWIMGLTKPWFFIPAVWTGEAGDWKPFSGRDVILLVGGLFLLAKATHEIHAKLEGPDAHGSAAGGKPAVASFGLVITQIILLDIVFSLDSVITAVGMVTTAPGKEWVALTVMITAVVMSVAVMLVAAGPISWFVDKHPTIKMLALSFLMLIGVMLVAEGFGAHIPKGYVYFAMAFSLLVELLNLRARRKSATPPVQLHSKYVAGDVERQVVEAAGK
jgi:predicted tellurium resistance membrane protein TerC